VSAAGGARTPEEEREARKETGRRAHGAPLVAHVLRLQLRSVVWDVSLGLLSVLTVASFPSIGQDLGSTR
jgi:hypothetical protein